MVEKPERFYLQSNRENIITDTMIQKFLSDNQELTIFLKDANIKLHPVHFGAYESFCYWIIAQQLSGHVAEIIMNRLRSEVQPLKPENLLAQPSEVLRKVGISKSKIVYLNNISTFFSEHPQADNLETLSNEEIKSLLLPIKGIGPWTINMFLIFNLGRLNVVAVGDLVVRKGIRILYGLQEIPSITEAKIHTQKWGKLGTIGSLLAWKVAENT